jgi:subtilisin family serine protease
LPGGVYQPYFQKSEAKLNSLQTVNLTALMELTSGSAEIMIGLIDGPVALDHADLTTESIRALPGGRTGSCTRADSVACQHGTFIAGILIAKRSSVAPALCPGCKLLLRPLFAETTTGTEQMPSAMPEDLASALLECMNAGARVLNLSVGLSRVSSKSERTLEEALDQAARRGVLVVAAAGNQGTLGSSALTRHPWVIPVVASNRDSRPTPESNLCASIGRRGLCAPGDAITSLGTMGQPLTTGGTSAAVPFVTGTIALLWSEFPKASAIDIKFALTQASVSRRATVIPPLLNAWSAYQMLRRLRP